MVNTLGRFWNTHQTLSQHEALRKQHPWHLTQALRVGQPRGSETTPGLGPKPGRTRTPVSVSGGHAQRHAPRATRLPPPRVPPRGADVVFGASTAGRRDFRRTPAASAGPGSRTGTGASYAGRRREVCGSAAAGNYISHKSAGLGVGDSAGQALPGDTKVNAGAAALRAARLRVRASFPARNPPNPPRTDKNHHPHLGGGTRDFRGPAPPLAAPAPCEGPGAWRSVPPNA